MHTAKTKNRTRREAAPPVRQPRPFGRDAILLEDGKHVQIYFDGKAGEIVHRGRRFAKAYEELLTLKGVTRC